MFRPHAAWRPIEYSGIQPHNNLKKIQNNVWILQQQISCNFSSLKELLEKTIRRVYDTNFIVQAENYTLYY